MVLCNKKISVSADVVQLSLSYSEVDVLRMAKYIFNQCLGGDNEWMQPDLLQTPQTEQLIRSYLARSPRCFGNYEAKWAEQLGLWAFNVCLRQGFLRKSATVDDCYYFTDLCVQKKRGRPTKA